MSNIKFCTCTDRDCAAHPENNSRECTACIANNLARHEIPICFWNQIGADTAAKSAYSFQKFAQRVMERESR